MLKFLKETFDEYCEALTSDDKALVILLIIIGLMFVVFVCLILTMIISAIVATNGLALIPVFVMYLVFKIMIAYGGYVSKSKED